MMTLEQIRDWHRAAQNSCQQTASSYFSGDDIGDQYQLMADEHKEMADAIDAHLAQQPDLAAIREVIADIVKWDENGDRPDEWKLREWHQNLARSVGDKP